ncbi:MAG TPA: cytochrome C [Gammaproteobacteria bacterium]|nr:cytochrome C [Gammaproteobacteria bacterium]
MSRTTILLATAALLLMLQTAHSEDITPAPQVTNESATDDPRQLVAMPDNVRALMRSDMQNHLLAINEIIGYLADNNLDAAAEAAESKMGKSTMGKHRATGKGPGMYMPLEMRDIGWGMHESASEFAQLAKKGDLKAAYIALQKVTTACVACHYSYRTQ